jgi:hypothetical protein
MAEIKNIDGVINLTSTTGLVSNTIALTTTGANSGIVIDPKKTLDIKINGSSDATLTTKTLTLKANDTYTITHASNVAAKDLTISQTGGEDSSLLLTSDGTGVDAIGLSATAGGVSISAAAASSVSTSVGAITVDGKTGVDLKFDGTSQANFSANGTATLKANDSYTITHASNVVDKDLTISQTGGVDSSLLLTSDGTGVDAIGLSATAGGVSISAAAASSVSTSVGAITVDGKTGVDLKFDGTSQANFSANGTATLKANDSYTITHASNVAAKDLTISQTGGEDSSLILTSDGTGVDAIGLSATAGGITLSATSGIQVNNDITLGTSDDTGIDYFYFKNSATNTKWWRMYVDGTGNFNIDRFNGTSWVNKSTLS